MVAAEEVICQHLGMTADLSFSQAQDGGAALPLEESEASGRWWKIGLAAVLGGGVLMVSGGLVAPFLLPAFGGLMTHVSVAASAVGVSTIARFDFLAWLKWAKKRESSFLGADNLNAVCRLLGEA